MDQPVFRFAPSPNGYLHLGHAYSAILCHDMARAAGGRFLVRLEDIDIGRCRPHFEDAIYEDLAWLGLAWDGPVMRQSERFDAYRAALKTLQDQDLLYSARFTRAEIARHVADFEAGGTVWPRDPDGAPFYPVSEVENGTAIDGSADQPAALRLRMDRAIAAAGALTWTETGAGPADETGRISADPAIWGDAVIARKDVPTSYHLAVVVDDAAQGITHVVRGTDLFWSTAIHRLLQDRLGLTAPIYHHHNLILNATGRKLAKSNADTGLRELRAAGHTPVDIRKMVGL